MTNQVALLVDGDNIGSHHAARLLGGAKGAGRLDIARVYTDASRPTGWLTASGYKVVHAGSGKNAADVLLAIEAAELAIERGIETFVLASSDGDFSHIARWLRERGCDVIGRGEDKAPAHFRAACTSFMNLPAPQPQARSVPVTLVDQVKGLIKTHGQKGSAICLADLARKMHKQHGTLISQQPERTWRAFLSARPQFFDVEPRGPAARVKLRSY